MTRLRLDRERVRGGAVLLGATAGLVVISAARWAGNPVTASSLLSVVVIGVAIS